MSAPTVRDATRHGARPIATGASVKDARARVSEYAPAPLMGGFWRLEREIRCYLEFVALARAPLAPTRPYRKGTQ